MRTTTLAACLLTSCVLCFAFTSRGDGPAAGGFKPVASVEGLMHGQGLVFKELSSLAANKSAKERMENIEGLSQALAEFANVNTFNRDKEDYKAWAAQLRDTALALSKEAEKDKTADEAQITKLMGQLKNTCQSCHDKYQED
ncbi:MAG: cytochrome c [Planctomycetota bacterium]